MTVRSETAMRKVCAKQEVMHKRSAPMSEDTHKKVSASVWNFTELDDKELFLWIDNMHHAHCPSTFTKQVSKQTKLLNNELYQIVTFSNERFHAYQFL